MRFAVVVPFPDPSQASNTQGSKADDISGSKVVNVWCDPTPIVEFEEMVTGFMIAANEDRQVWRSPGAAVVFVEIGHLAVLLGH